MTEPVLRTEDLHVWFETPAGATLHAVRGVSIELGAGERLGLAGESGCGKSTLALALMGLLPPAATVSGSVIVAGRDMLGPDRLVRQSRWVDIAMVFQGAMNSLNPVLSIGTQMIEGLKLHGVASGADARRRSGELLDRVGLPASVLDRYPHQLSGGMRQRASLAMALACEPKVLLADEPTTGLDVMVQAQILQLLEELSADLGLAVLFVSHDLPALAQVCPRAAVMYAGRVIEQGPITSLLDSPAHPYTRMLFAATPDIDKDVTVASIPGAPPRLDRALAGCAFADRCDCTFGDCTEHDPRLTPVGPSQVAACHLNTAEGYRGRA